MRLIHMRLTLTNVRLGRPSLSCVTHARWNSTRRQPFRLPNVPMPQSPKRMRMLPRVPTIPLELHQTTAVPTTAKYSKRTLFILGNAAYLSLVSGFLMTDVLVLRALLAGGYSGLVLYHSLQQRPLWIPLAWSCVFVVVNAAYGFSLAGDRWPGQLSEEDKQLHKERFPHMTSGQFRQLISLAERVTIPHGTELTHEAVHCEQLFYILRGRCNLYLRTALAADIDKGGFVNDVAFQQRDDPTAGAYGTVIVSSRSGVEALTWNAAELAEYLRTRPEMRRNLDHVLVQTLVKGLMRQREVAHEREVASGQTDGQTQAQAHATGTPHAQATSSATAVPAKFPFDKRTASEKKRQRLQMTTSELHVIEAE